MSDKSISPHTRKRLWTHAGDRCAFPDCDRRLLHKTRDGTDETVVGIECHIVAQRDHPSVARAPCLLSEGELVEYVHLVEDRHGFPNLVVMCGEHSDVIDDPKQRYSVAEVIAMKAGHEAKIQRERQVRQATLSPGDPVAPFVFADLPAWEGKAIIKLVTSEPSTWAWLTATVGEPAEPAAVVKLIREWPDQVAEGSIDLHYALARIAEAHGEWDAATNVWERVADRSTDDATRADHLVRAAIDAAAGGDQARRDRLVDVASKIDATSPRLLVERMGDLDLTPEGELEYLSKISSDDAPLAALIAAHKARAALLLPDLEQAEAHLRLAEELAPDALNVRTASVNVRVQRARVALVADRPSSLDEARGASDEALEVRELMLAMRRFDESVRLLMLAADVLSVQRDGEAASKILNNATPEEIASIDGVAVLGDGALRAGDPELALRFAMVGRNDDDGARRIAATARIDLNDRRAEALDELRELALAGGEEALQAACARLTACMPPVGAPWDEDVARVLDVDHPEQLRRTLASLRIMTMARTGNLTDAEHALEDLPDQAWAAEIALRVAAIRGNSVRIQETAERFLEFGPDASGQLLAARAFARAGKLSRAAQTLATITNDPNVPPRVRTDAFATMMRVLADDKRWDRAATVWDAWSAFTRSEGIVDDQLSAWQVRIAHRRRTSNSR